MASNSNDKVKGPCTAPSNSSAAPDKAEACNATNGNAKAKENCSPKVNVATPSTSGAKKDAAPSNRRLHRKEKKKTKAAIDAEQRIQENRERKEFYRSFFKENKEILYLLDHHTITLRARSNSEFSCASCSVQISNFKKVHEHVKSDKHRMLLETYWLSRQDDLPSLHPSVMSRIDSFVTSIADSLVLSRKAVTLRTNIAKEINRIFQDVPDCRVVMCGSSYHTAGLNTSDLNLRFVVDEKDRNPVVFNSLISRISNAYPGRIRIKKHMYSKNYYCLFTYKKTLCEIKFFEKKHLFNSILVERCAKFDPRVKLLFVLFRHWAKLCRVINKSGESWHSLALDLMVIYFLQHTENPVLPIFNNISQCKREVDLSAEMFLALNGWQTNNEEPLGVLWCNLLNFYSNHFDKVKDVVEISTEDDATQNPKQGCGKRLCVTDPFAPPANLLSAPSLEPYALFCLKKTNFYFRTPQTAAGSVFDFIRHDSRPSPLEIDGYDAFVADQVNLTSLLVKSLLNLASTFKPLLESKDISSLRLHQKKWTDNYVNVCNLNIKPYNPNSSYVSLRKPGQKVALFFQDASLLMTKFNPDHSVFHFQEQLFNGGMKVPVNCQFCGKEVHAGECPFSMTPEMAPSTMISGKSVISLNNVCTQTLRKYLLDSKDEFLRNKVIREIEYHIQQFFPSAILTPFGSSRNGFGLKNSDLDLCLTFTDDTYENDFNAEIFLKSLYRTLRRLRPLSHVTCISKATVPIVKFVHTPSRLEGDISIYNTLAIVNTNLLKLYCQLDQRVQILGVMVKSFADTKNILGAPKGYLSSYAYILMVIHFLQNCNPPVVPVLQELTADPNSPVPTIMHSEHNVYYLDNVDTVRKVWPRFGLNEKSPGELWIEFLYYYSIIFDIDNLVVTIRTLKQLTKQEKQWYVRTLAVEDPFRMNTNLGRGLCMKRHNDIVQCFRDELQRHLIQHPVSVGVPSK